VAAGPTSQLSFVTAPPASAQSGSALAPQPSVQLRDAVGNAVAQAGVQVSVSLASGTGALGGSTTATTNGAGVAGFSGLSITGPAGSYTLSFAATGITPLVSGPIVLGAGQAATLFIAIQPSSSAQSGVALSQQPAIQLRDASGNPVAQSGVVITAAIASGTGALGGATTATTNSAGLAQFSSLAVNGASGTYTLRFSATGLTSTVSGPIVLGAGAPTALGITVQPPAAATSGATFGQQPAVQLRDGSGNPVALAGVQVTASVTGGGATLLGTATASTNAAGLASFTNLGLSGPVGSYTLGFASSGLTPAVSSSIALSAGSASRLGLTIQPSPAGASGAVLAQQPVVQVRDAAGNAVAQGGVLVTATIASGPAGATLGGTTTATTNGFGAASFTNLAIAGPSGTYTLRFAAAGLTEVVSSGVTLGAGAATKLFITTQPSATAQSGAALSQQPVVQLRDAANNPVAQAGVTVTAAIGSGGGTLGGTTTAVTNGSGVASFSNLSISGLIGPRTLAFSAPGLTGASSSTITLAAGAATRITITTQPSSTAQSAIPFAQQPVLQLRDAAGNAVSQAGVGVTASIASGGGLLGGTTTVSTSAAGTASFSNLSITGLAGDRTLGFAAGALTGATSGVISVTAGLASKLVITTQPSASVQSGVAFPQQPVIRLQDAFGNNVATAGVVVTAAISSGGGTLGGTLTATTNASGIASFSNLAITGTAGARTLVFTASGYTSITSETVTVGAGGASQLSITTQPSSTAQSGVAFPQQPVIQLRDPAMNPVSQAGVVVTASIASGGGSLGGTVTATTNSAGVASFSNLSISGSTGARTLNFSASGLSPVTSNAISLVAGPASQLTVTTQPSASAQSGVVFPQQPVIQLRDAAGNPVSQSGVAVTATIGSGPSASLGGTATVTTNSSGVASFATLSLSGPAGSYTLEFGSGSRPRSAPTRYRFRRDQGRHWELLRSLQPRRRAASSWPSSR
jgi:hypothetical protein